VINKIFSVNNDSLPDHRINARDIPKCIILAAGSSTRLRPWTDSIPKCLLEVGGKAILERTIENVLAAGVQDIALVVGYRSTMIREFVQQRFPSCKIRFILNPNYAQTNNAYSLLLARRFLEDNHEKVMCPCLLLDSDILFSPNVLPYLMRDESKNKIAVRVQGDHNEEEIRVTVNARGTLVLIGKHIPLEETYGESIGIEMFSADAAAQLFAILMKRVRNGMGRTEYYEASFQEMIDHGTELTSVDVSIFPSIEIDTIEDLECARQMTLE
jgi:choline kinase